MLCSLYIDIRYENLIFFMEKDVGKNMLFFRIKAGVEKHINLNECKVLYYYFSSGRLSFVLYCNYLKLDGKVLPL